MNIQLSLNDARELAITALKSIKFNQEDAEITADHLIDAAMRGVTFGSLPRILSIAEKIKAQVEESVKFAEDSPYPEAEELYKDVYAQQDYHFVKD